MNLIRTSKLDAQIDSESGTVIMEPSQPNVYEYSFLILINLYIEKLEKQSKCYNSLMMQA